MADPDLQIRGGGGGGGAVIQTLRYGGARSPKNIFRPFGPQFGLKLRRDPPLQVLGYFWCGVAPPPPPLSQGLDNRPSPPPSSVWSKNKEGSAATGYAWTVRQAGEKNLRCQTKWIHVDVSVGVT